MTVITIGDCAVVTQGKNIDKKFLLYENNNGLMKILKN